MTPASVMEEVRIQVLPDGRVARNDAALFLGYKPKTLAEWHRLGKGPRSRMVGGRRFYDIAELRAFAGRDAAGQPTLVMPPEGWPAPPVNRDDAEARAVDDLTDRFWLILREPGMVPDRKGPWPHREAAKVLREFMRARPTAFVDVLKIGPDGTPDVEHGPLVLQYTDGRSMSVGRKHNERVKAAALSASPSQPVERHVAVPTADPQAFEADVGSLGRRKNDSIFELMRLINGGAHIRNITAVPVDRANDEQRAREKIMRSAIVGITDDYMTSESHHPGYVLISSERFDRLRCAEKVLLYTSPTEDFEALRSEAGLSLEEAAEAVETRAQAIRALRTSKGDRT